MKRIWPVLAAGCVLLGGPRSAFAEWREDVAADRSAGKRNVVMTNAALNSASQFGRKVSATLVLRCDASAGLAKQPRAAIVFSERVATDAVNTKYRIDNDPVRRNKMASVRDDGRALALDWAEFMTQLPSSSILRVEFSLPWAGHTLLEFDTAGANEAFRRISCSGPKSKQVN